jgi:DeoR/GlpR family transcriptional regulator of sugar metabolism
MTKELFLEERRHAIVELLRSCGRASVADLSRRFSVSDMTIRTDLQALAERRLLVRTHGGALAVERAIQELSFAVRSRQQPQAKERIGQVAAALVSDGEAIFLDTSSTALQIARSLKDRRDLTVVTNGIAIAQELLDARGITVVLPGGLLRRDSLSLVGTDGLALLDRYNLRRGFFGAHGLTLGEGLTDVSIEEADVKRLLAPRCREVVAVLDSTKLGRVGVASFAAACDVDVLVTDAGEEALHPFAHLKMRVIRSQMFNL